MTLKALYYKHTLNFRFDAGTSRGVLKNKDSFLLKIWNTEDKNQYGLGEASPLSGLSLDFSDVQKNLEVVCDKINKGEINCFNFNTYCLEIKDQSSIVFALETAFFDLINLSKREIFKNPFFNFQSKIPINGLVWMGTKDFMHRQIKEKIELGFDTIKLKIGAIDFKEEIELLNFIRKEYTEKEIVLRVDANGAFKPNEALEKLKILSDLKIHSIEQPIAPHQHQLMAELCEISPLPIALDEELITPQNNKLSFLQLIKPQYIILKPTLMGGFNGSREWISAADQLNIGWWITSALESNIGLNAICQFTAEFQNELPQGLGTGQLYHNNFESPLTIEAGKIFYDKFKKWELDRLSN
jgi:O-succinylbenzoate synthase